MTSNAITYQSSHYDLGKFKTILETKTYNGITCTWTAEMIDNNTNIKNWWKFNWDELKEDGIDELTGYIIVRRPVHHESARFNVLLTSNNNVIERTMKTAYGANARIEFDYCLTPHLQTKEIPNEEMFLQSEKTDAILVIHGEKLHVNKAFLSFHSEYFRALFSSNFKEGTMNEIPIGDVNYEDFACLLSIIYPQNLFPDDNNVEKLLELADRFIMPCIIRTVEHHLLNISKLSNGKLICLADKYNMPALLKKTIRRLDCVEGVKQLKNSAEYNELSDETKAALFERVMQLI